MGRPIRESLESILRSWGIDITRAPKRPSREKIVVYLRNDDGTRIHVGELSQEEGRFVFRYSDEYKKRADVQPVSGFQDKTREYQSDVLWPFFQTRIPSLKREDVLEVMKRKNIKKTDTIRILGELARTAIANPYELELVA